MTETEHTASSRTAIYTHRLYEAMSWDEWLPVDDLYAKVWDTVPSGKALRKYQSNKAKTDEKKEADRLAKEQRGEMVRILPERPLDQAGMIRSGKRMILNDSLGALRVGGSIEVEAVDGVRHARRRERRSECNCRSRMMEEQPPSFTIQPIKLTPDVVVVQDGPWVRDGHDDLFEPVTEVMRGQPLDPIETALLSIGYKPVWNFDDGPHWGDGV